MDTRFVLIIVFSLACHFAMCQAQAQPEPVQPTSATDPGVKIHSTRKLFSFNHNKNLRKYKSHAHITEREGRSLPRQRPKKRYRTKESDVYKRKSALAKKDRTRTKLKIYRKHSMARN